MNFFQEQYQDLCRVWRERDGRTDMRLCSAVASLEVIDDHCACPECDARSCVWKFETEERSFYEGKYQIEYDVFVCPKCGKDIDPYEINRCINTKRYARLSELPYYDAPIAIRLMRDQGEKVWRADTATFQRFCLGEAQ